MNPRLARWIARLYPPAWRKRYGEEFEALLEASPNTLKTVVNSVCSAVSERMFPTQGGNMQPNPDSFVALIKHPSAFIPVAMSLLALTMVLIVVGTDLAFTGAVVRSPDEGPAAHLFQILMTVQMPIALFFAIKWLRRAPAQSLGVLALQAGAWLVACAPVFLLHL
jgi:hypothetical protein